jgi:hypothetical protein
LTKKLKKVKDKECREEKLKIDKKPHPFCVAAREGQQHPLTFVGLMRAMYTKDENIM